MWGSVSRYVSSVLSLASSSAAVCGTTSRREGSPRKRRRVEISCTVEHTVVELLIQTGQLGAPGLAVLCCLSRSFRQACEDDGLWQMACVQRWPSLHCSQAEEHILYLGGYRKFYQLQFSVGGELQLNVASNRTEKFLADILFLLDVSYRNKPVFSHRIAGGQDLESILLKDSVAFRLPDMNLGVHLQGIKGSPRRATEGAGKLLNIDVIALRLSDHKTAHLMQCRGDSLTLVGSSLFITFKNSFMLPGIFQMTRLSTEAILTVTNRRVDRTSEEPTDYDTELLLGALGLEFKLDFFPKKNKRLNKVDVWRELKWK